MTLHLPKIMIVTVRTPSFFKRGGMNFIYLEGGRSNKSETGGDSMA